MKNHCYVTKVQHYYKLPKMGKTKDLFLLCMILEDIQEPIDPACQRKKIQLTKERALQKCVGTESC
jgi:hypothetical protein